VKQKKTSLGGALLAVLLSLTAGTIAARAATPGEVGIGQVLPEATLAGLNGPSKKLGSFRGKPLIINVWASWCGPCRREMASLDRLAWLEQSSSFNVIGISTDDYRDKALDWLAHSNATINQYLDSNLQMENMLGANRLPLTVLIGADGRVLDKVYGAREWDSPDSIALIRARFGSAKAERR
jgi:thiol-disulfide isomerase/thioredoxin